MSQSPPVDVVHSSVFSRSEGGCSFTQKPILQVFSQFRKKYTSQNP